MHWVDERCIHHHVGGALKERGWETYGYTPTVSDPQSDSIDWCRWCGLATHQRYPGVVIVVLADAVNTLVIEQPGLVIHDGSPNPPAYTPLKKGKTWHIERDGEIIAQGGIPKDLRHPGRSGAGVVSQFVDKLERLCQRN